MMNRSKHVQKAGEGSNQYQANTIIVQNGIDEKRAREICSEMFDVARRDLTAEAYETACKRVNEFENDLIPRMKKIEGALDVFGDPSFQFLITDAHRTAAATDRPADYALLSELLIHRIQRGTNRTTVAGVSRAVEIVDKISDDALLALSVVFAVEQYAPMSGSVSKGLNTLNDLYGKLCYDELPSGGIWLDHLDILDAVRISSFGTLKKLEEYYAEVFGGYCVAGIKGDSDDYDKAKKLLADAELPNNLLVVNELDSEYFRLPIVAEQAIEQLSLKKNITIAGNVVTASMELSEEQKHVLRTIFAMYDKNPNVHEKIKTRFYEEIAKRENLKKVQEWWNSIPSSFEITIVGKVLAHANAKRCDNTLPDMN